MRGSKAPCTCKLTSSVKRKSLAAPMPSLELCVTLGLSLASRKRACDRVRPRVRG